MVELNLITKVEIFLCARDLPNNNSDLFCVIYGSSYRSQSIKELGRTEILPSTSNPTWKTSIILDFYFEMKQNLLFTIQTNNKANRDLAEINTTLGNLVSSGTSTLNLPDNAKLIIRIEELKPCNDHFKFIIRGVKLDKKDIFGKSDPYLIFYRQLAGGSWTEIYKTEVIKNTLDPVWSPIDLSTQRLCNGDLKKPIKIECYDWNSIMSHELIGSNEVTLTQLMQKKFCFDLFESDANRKKGKKAGVVEVVDVFKKSSLSFIDYLRVGVRISFTVAIDFTLSNGEHGSPHSLHYVSPERMNEYEKAILEIGGILEVYDSDRYFPVYGFGGIPKGARNVSHCFPLTFDQFNPFVHRVEGILEVYHNSLSNVTISGPTYFHKIIDTAISVARQTDPTEQYNILLILTDGELLDMTETIDSIIEASETPMSIIIIGLGTADFSKMHFLDCDQGRLSNTRRGAALRDIVQFVPFSKFSGNATAMAAEVLEEVPRQLTEFMEMIKYAPEVPEQRPFSTAAELRPEENKTVEGENRKYLGYDQPEMVFSEKQVNGKNASGKN